jgi:hypothetical protein
VPGRDVVTEHGSKRVFASAVDWPGWCRSARDAAGALSALVAYGPRYADVVRGVRPAFRPPKDISTLRVIEQLEGNATTDFGAPDAIADDDARPIGRRELTRLRSVLEACWAAFDQAVDGAEGVELIKGPRGGGRELRAIVGHVIGAEAGYLHRLGVRRPAVGDDRPTDAKDDVRGAVVEGLASAVLHGQPERGPRGGSIWTPRRFLRRAAWHVLDHVWEIQDRSGNMRR